MKKTYSIPEMEVQMIETQGLYTLDIFGSADDSDQLARRRGQTAEDDED